MAFLFINLVPSGALDDIDDLDELLLGDEETDNLDLGGDIDDEELFA